MWIRTLNPNDPDYAKREERYAQHVNRLKSELSGSAFHWFLRDELHDSTIAQLGVDLTAETLLIAFDHVGEWPTVDGKVVRPRTRRLIFEFSGVAELSLSMSEGTIVSVEGLEYITGELNTNPDIRSCRGLNSLNMTLSGRSLLEISFVFRRIEVREQGARET